MRPDVIAIIVGVFTLSAFILGMRLWEYFQSRAQKKIKDELSRLDRR